MQPSRPYEPRSIQTRVYSYFFTNLLFHVFLFLYTKINKPIAITTAAAITARCGSTINIFSPALFPRLIYCKHLAKSLKPSANVYHFSSKTNLIFSDNSVTTASSGHITYNGCDPDEKHVCVSPLPLAA